MLDVKGHKSCEIKRMEGAVMLSLRNNINTSIRVLWISLSAEVPSEKRRPPTGKKTHMRNNVYKCSNYHIKNE